jgi:hypothetical protein
MKKQNTLREIKHRMEFEELKTNLLRSTNSLRTLKKADDEICNYSKTNTNFFNKNSITIGNDTQQPTLADILKKMLKIKKENRNVSKEILHTKVSSIQKEKMIRQMIEEIKFFENENSQLSTNLAQIKELKKEIETNRAGVEEFCKELKIKFKSYVQIIDKYEDKIRILKKDRDQLIHVNDQIVEMKCKILIY